MRTFYSRYEKALRKTATTEVSGRLQGTTDVAIEDFASPPATKTPKANYELFGPGDVQRLAAGAITRRFPAPNSSDAEVTKTALDRIRRGRPALALHTKDRRQHGASPMDRAGRRSARCRRHHPATRRARDARSHRAEQSQACRLGAVGARAAGRGPWRYRKDHRPAAPGVRPCGRQPRLHPQHRIHRVPRARVQSGRRGELERHAAGHVRFCTTGGSSGPDRRATSAISPRSCARPTSTPSCRTAGGRSAAPRCSTSIAGLRRR